MKHAHSHHALFAIAISVTLFVYALYGYMHYRIDASLAHVVELRATVAQEQSYKEQEQTITTVHNETMADRDRIGTFFVKDTATISFIETIESLGDRIGSAVTLSSIEADNLEGKEMGTLGRIRAHVDVKGSWSSVMRTIISAEVLPYKVTVSGVHLDASGISDTKGATREWHATFIVDAVLVHATP